MREILNDIVADDKRAADVILRLRRLLQKGDLEYAALDLNEVATEVARLVTHDAVDPQRPDAPRAGRRPAAGARRPSPAPAGGAEPRAQWPRRHAGTARVIEASSSARPADGAAVAGIAVQDCGDRDRRQGHGPHLPAAVHDQGRGPGHGPGDRADDRRGARRPARSRATTTHGGATFQFTLPVGTGGRRDDADARGPMVFIVDDDPSVRKSLVRVLTSAGYAVEDFASAQEFLARAALRRSVLPGAGRADARPHRAGPAGDAGRRGAPDVHRLRDGPRRHPDERQGHEGRGPSIS